MSLNQKYNELVNNRKIKKVAILGAGASADAGAPIICNFWKKVKELMKTAKFNQEEIDKFQKILQKRKELLPDSDIEEFFSYVDFQARFDVLIPTPTFARNIQYRIFNKKNINCTPILSDTQHIGNEKKRFYQIKRGHFILN